MHLLRARTPASSSQRGFGLVELIVVVAILGVLVLVAIPVFGAVQNNARNEAVKSELSSFAKGMENQKVENGGKYPAVLTKEMGFAFTPGIYGRDYQSYAVRYCYNPDNDQYILYALTTTGNYFSATSSRGVKAENGTYGWGVCDKIGLVQRNPSQNGFGPNDSIGNWIHIR